MPVTVDQENIDTAGLGFATVGDVLAWAGRERRMVVRLLIDGESPDLSRMDAVRKTVLTDRHVYVETADPRMVAMETIAQAERRLTEAAAAKEETVALLRENKWTEAMSRLGVCLGGWLAAQQSAAAVAKMSGIQLETIQSGGRTVAELTGEFAGQLRRIQTAVQDGDSVGLIDLLVYETEGYSSRWNLLLARLKTGIAAENPVLSAA